MPNGKIIFPEQFLNGLGHVDLAEAERRFTAERGSLEVVQPGPTDPAERARWKARNHLKQTFFVSLWGGALISIFTVAFPLGCFVARSMGLDHAALRMQTERDRRGIPCVGGGVEVGHGADISRASRM